MARVITAIPEIGAFYSGNITSNINLETGQATTAGGVTDMHAQCFGASCGVEYVGYYNDIIGGLPEGEELDSLNARLLSVFNSWAQQWIDYNNNLPEHYLPIVYVANYNIYKSYVNAVIGYDIDYKYKYYYTMFGSAYNYFDSDNDGEYETEIVWYSDYISKEGPISSGYTLGFSGLELVRDVFDISPDDRNPMHVTDFGAGDALHVSDNLILNVSFDGMSASVDISSVYPNGTDITEENITGGDVAFWSFGSAISLGGLLPAGTNFGTISMGGDTWGFDLSLLDAPTQSPNADAIGSGSEWTIVINTSGNFSCGYSLSVGTPLIWGYEPVGDLFLDESGFDPLIGDSFYDQNDVEVFYLLSELPSLYVDVPLYTMPFNRNPLPKPIKRSSTYSPYIQTQWAYDNYYYLTDTTEDDEIGIETHGDQFISVYVPGIDEATTDVEPYRPIYSVTKSDTEILPFRSTNAWIPTGDIIVGLQIFDILQTGSGSVSRVLDTRYYDRIELLGQYETPHHWDWVRKFKSYGAGLGKWIDDEPDQAEDVYCWKDYSFLYIRFDIVQQPEDIETILQDLTLTLNFTIPTISDQHYTCGGERVDAFEASYYSSSVEYNFNLSGPTIDRAWLDAYIDLLCPSNGSTPELWIVDSIQISGFQNESTIATLSLELVNLDLVSDAGYDHTGRNITEDVLPEDWADVVAIKNWDNWDFLSDWAGFNVFYEGLLNICHYPDDPWKGGVPEYGFGSIQPLNHCPLSAGTGMLHYHRPLESIGVLNDGGEGWGVSINESEIDAMTIGVSADTGITPTTMVSPVMCWAENWMALTPGFETGAIHSRYWVSTRGRPYKCHFRKIVGGSIHALLKKNNGRARFTKFDCTTQQFAVWRIRSYFDVDDNPIADPVGFEASGTYSLETSGLMSDVVDYQGMFSLNGGFKPSRVTINANDDYCITDYYGQIWPNETWIDYNINTHLELMASKSLAVFTFQVENRRWNSFVQQVKINRRGKLDSGLTPWGMLLIAADDSLSFEDYVSENAGRIVVHKYSRHVASNPEETIVSKELFNPSFCILTNGWLIIAGESGAGEEIELYITDSLGRDLNLMSEILENHSNATIRTNPNDGAIYMCCKNITSNFLEIYRIQLGYWQENGTDLFSQINDNVTGDLVDDVSPGLTYLTDGAILVTYVEADVIKNVISTNAGQTFSVI